MNLVTIVTPTTPDRRYFIDALSVMVDAQTYKNIEWLIDESDDTIGAKLNRMCERAKGEFICRMDSDDYYAPDWIERSIASIGSNDMIGLRKAYFYNDYQKLGRFYQTTNPQPFCLGATMFFRRSMWEKNKFNERVRSGEDSLFTAHAGKVVNHDYIDGFTALIHDRNTTSQHAFRSMPIVEINLIPYVRKNISSK